MTEKMIENRIKKLQAIEAQQKELDTAAEAIRAELKADLEEKAVDELKTKSFILRWKEIISNRLDGKTLKAALPDVYSQFCKASTSRRFTIARERLHTPILPRQGYGATVQQPPSGKANQAGDNIGIIPASSKRIKEEFT